MRRSCWPCGQGGLGPGCANLESCVKELVSEVLEQEDGMFAREAPPLRQALGAVLRWPGRGPSKEAAQERTV